MDTLHRFLFDKAAVRGSRVQLDAAWQTVLERHAYPAPVRAVLGEMLAASVLLAASLKFDGSLILQIQGDGPLRLAVVECTSDLAVRATARWEGEVPEGFRALLGCDEGGGRFVLTLDPRNGKQAWQGIVATDGNSVAECLEHYFARSEQLPTRIWLCADENHAAGMLLQEMPLEGGVSPSGEDDDAWNRITSLAATVRPDELSGLDAEKLLGRLFHGELGEGVRLFGAQAVRFSCTCSRQRVAAMLRMMGAEELDLLIAEQGEVDVGCEFCNQRYVFDAVDCAALLREETTPSVPTRH